MTKAPTAPKKPLTITQIIPLAINGGLTILGLGCDSRIYAWDSKIGQWIPNWNKPVPAKS